MEPVHTEEINTKHGLFLRFECGAEDRMSAEYGPFECIQNTYENLREGGSGLHLARYDVESQVWLLRPEPDVSIKFSEEDLAADWTDVIIFYK